MKTIDPLEIIDHFYHAGTLARGTLITHSRLVAEKALAIAGRISAESPDMDFLYEAAMLHDIGIIRVNAPRIGCFGTAPYILHGPLGREMLEELGLRRHALVCERHTGVGISRQDIRDQQLPLPDREMRPVSLEEQIICYADCFFSKNPKKLRFEKPLDKVRKSIGKFGPDKAAQFEEWVERFGA